VTVHVNTEAHRVINRLFPHSRNPEDIVGADVANSLSFFTNMYGPPLFKHYYATEIPYYHGQAFPGLIHLSWVTFINYASDGEDESFRAHEMAHQWWYYGVEPASYRDAWMSEGFAEFSGLWYMQSVLHDNDKYLKKLRTAREDIRRERSKAAPLGIGTRAAESWRGDYQLITYEKGAWVLHMLRNMLLDTRCMTFTRPTAASAPPRGIFRKSSSATRASRWTGSSTNGSMGPPSRLIPSPGPPSLTAQAKASSRGCACGRKMFPTDSRCPYRC